MKAVRKTQNYCWCEGDYIGKGTYGKVYRGFDLYTNHRVAIKVYDVRRLNQFTRQYTDDVHRLSQFNSTKVNRPAKEYIEDVHSLSRLNCPFIVHYFARECVEGSQEKEAIIMELADGNLHDELRKPENRFGLPKPLFFTLMDNCVQALLDLGKCQIAHRDLKPENILICRTDAGVVFKLTDFGCSKTISYNDEPLISIVGTGPYMPSSVVKGKATGVPVAEYTKDQFDIWSATCCFFEAATGRVPFLPDKSRNYFKAMNELLMGRIPGTVCAHFDSVARCYVYQKDMPEQNSTYNGFFREILCEFFQLMFSKEKKYLDLGLFAQLCRNLKDFDGSNSCR